MQQNISLRLLPAEASNDAIVKKNIARFLGVKSNVVTGYHRIKQSVDARSKQAYITLMVKAFINEPFTTREIQKILLKDVAHAKHRVIIIGAGPAGLFAA